MGMGVITELATAAPGYNSIRPITRALIFSADETADVGRDTASPVSDDYDGESSVFTGTVAWVQIDLGEDGEDADHLVAPEERLRVAMARQ
jgi:arylsulfatase